MATKKAALHMGLILEASSERWSRTPFMLLALSLIYNMTWAKPEHSRAQFPARKCTCSVVLVCIANKLGEADRVRLQ